MGCPADSNRRRRRDLTAHGQPEASCHKSKGSCRQCGIELYCEGQPPPLLGGNKVCVGASRVGERKPRARSRQTTRRCAHLHDVVHRPRARGTPLAPHACCAII
eukprot:5397223-Prymnesium_polylepis.1